KIKAGIRIRAFESAELADSPACPQHVFGLGLVAGKLQRKIGLNRRVHFRRSARKYVPTSIAKLPAADILRQLRDAALAESSQHMKVKDVIRFERRVCFKFAQPVTIIVLQ